MNATAKGSKPGPIAAHELLSAPVAPAPIFSATSAALPPVAEQRTCSYTSDKDRFFTASNLKDESSNKSTSTEESKDEHEYPEGGKRAWLVVLGSFAGMMACFGMMNTVGVFQAYLSTHQLVSYSESTIGWIFSVYIFLSFFCGLQIGPVFDAKGPRYLILSGSILLVACMLLIGVCTQYYHFMIVFGIIGGIGTSLIFTPAVSAIGHFFLVKRGAATGIGAAGGSVGGIVFPLMLQALIPKIGWAWATRVMGFICIFLLIIASLTIRSRLPPKLGQSVLPDFRIFRDPAFSLTILGVFCMEWGLFVPVTYMASFALSTHSISETFSYQLIALLNVGSSFGRWAPGYFADRIGRFNAMILALLLCLLTTVAFWLTPSLLAGDPSSDQAVIRPIIIVYALLFGFASGSNISLTPVCVGQMCDTEEYGRYYATCYTVVSFGTLTGIPIAGALLQATKGAYWGVIIFTAGCYAISLLAFVGARVLKTGTTLRQVF